eukprot:gene2803-2037_t
MSSFEEESGFTPVENLNHSNFRVAFSPVSMLNKSAFSSPKLFTEVDLTTPVFAGTKGVGGEMEGMPDPDEPIAAVDAIPTKRGSAQLSISPVALSSHEFESARTMQAPTLGDSENPIVVDSVEAAPAPVSLAEEAPENSANDEDESLRFALQLQYEEEEELIQMQLSNLRSVVIAGGLSGDDIGTMQLMMSDLQHQLQYIRASAAALSQPALSAAAQEDEERSFIDSQAGDDDDAEDADGGGADEDEEEEEQEEQWDYDQLLQLGARLGDVKTERWRMRAQSIIDSLPSCAFADVRTHIGGQQPAAVVDLAEDSAIIDLLNDSMESTKNEGAHVDKKAKRSHEKPAQPTASQAAPEEEEEHCIVCMEPYIAEDMVRVLPCSHFFHCHCTQGWLADHNSCPYCKTKVTASP